MIILANLLGAIAYVLDMVLGALIFFVIVSALLSWVNPDPFNPIVRFLRSVTEPFLIKIRRYVPPINGRIDLSPLVLLLVLYFVQYLLVGTLRDYEREFKRQSLPSIIFEPPAAPPPVTK